MAMTGEFLKAQAIADRSAILLFFKDWERDKYFKYDRYLKRAVRSMQKYARSLQRKSGNQWQEISGIRMSFELLVRALNHAGWSVYINDRALAQKNPHYPVGLVGWLTLLEGWNLPNPAILGPSLYDHPLLAPRLMDDTRFRKYVVLAPWHHEMFRAVYGDACVQWFAGIDTEQWPDTAVYVKDIDFIIYDKLWDHDKMAVELLQPIQRTLHCRGFSSQVIRYHHYDHATYQSLLRRSRAMIFLCAHETQGLAYQEALASNVPILAWDNGFWTNSLWKRFSETRIPASSVPFFSESCGETFRDITQFEAALARFLNRLGSLEPRKYVTDHLSMQESAHIYATHYFSIAS